MDGNYSVVREMVWERADTVVWFDLSYAVVMARTVRRTLRRVVTREVLWNGNREPWSNLYSFDPKKSIIAWAATRHAVYRRRYREAEHDPRWAGLRFVRLRSQREADAFLAEVRKGGSDTQVLAWVRERSARFPSDIAAWDAWMRGNAPGGVGGHAWFSELIKANAPDRQDIFGFFDLLDMDDYVSFGGKP